MNYIVSCLFTTCIDPLRGIKWDLHPQIMDNWYNSGVKLCQSNNNIKLVIFHDGLTDNFISKYNPEYTIFIKTAECENYSPHDFRWFVYENFTQNNEFDNVFFTDISDVLIKNNPFLELDHNMLYMVDEEGKIWDNEWTAPRHSYYQSRLSDYEDVFKTNDNNQFLNAGILGGCRDIVLLFLEKMVEYSKLTMDNKHGQITDMLLFNYINYKYFPKRKHGFPINSIFQKNEIHREDVWFIHK